MGRYRQYDSDAERQSAYRQRKAEELQRLRERSKPAHRDRLRKKLVRVLGQLGSDNKFVRDEAAKAAAKMVKDAGLTWFDVLDVTDEK